MPIAARDLLAVVEPVLYSRTGRRACVLTLVLATLLLGALAVQVRPDASFDKSLPLEHAYMQVFRQYQQELGGANTVLIALVRRGGTIYDERFLATLKAATEEVFFTPGIDRARVSSIFTRDVRYVEVVDGGVIAEDVIPAEYAPTPEMFELIRTNVGKAGVIGRLVGKDQRGAMVVAEVLERDPATFRRTDYARVAEDLEDKLRRRFSSPTRYVYRLKEARPPFAAGEVVGEEFRARGVASRWLRTFAAERAMPDGSVARVELRAGELALEVQPNPQYNPDVDVHIIGFAKVVGDVADATAEVVGFFLLTVLATMLALWWYLGDLRLALLPLACSAVAVVWEFGLLRAFGYGLDPFAILVPFLVLAVSTSHGVQYVSTWADEVLHGRDGFDASRETFRRLFIPGTVALVTNVAGFLTLQLVPIEIIREMSTHACLGMFAVIVTNKAMMPVWLSHLGVADVAAFRARRRRRMHAGDRLWRTVSVVTEAPVAAGLVVLSLAVLALSWSYQGRRIVGDAQAGVPELRPDSVYNRDVRAIVDGFAIGTDLLKIVAETEPSGCAQFGVLDQIDRFAWHVENVAGVQSVKAFTTVAEQFHSGLWELSPKLRVLPRNQNVLAMVNHAIHTNTGLLNPDCSAMPVLIFTADHRAATVARIVRAVKDFNAANAREFYEDHPQAAAAACDERTQLRRDAGVAHARLEERRALLRAQGWTERRIAADPEAGALAEREAALQSGRAALPDECPVHFAIASGNVGVMAATNEVVSATELPTVLWVYAVIAALLILSYRSVAALLAICIPLFMVSIFANALMAYFGIGLKVATLPVVALAVGVGVDYGIYIYDVLHEQVHVRGLPLREAYYETLRRTGKAVLFTGLCLAGGVASWLFSDLQFQRDMGLLLVFMFGANMLGAVLLCPAYCRFLMRGPLRRADEAGTPAA
ncbi:MAG: MMPL family transporter [Gammaproteobacteria bacterium]|nr:MMPL family transporter [Gammaproteobacteria bacterium]